jgi:hypothetical protein
MLPRCPARGERNRRPDGSRAVFGEGATTSRASSAPVLPLSSVWSSCTHFTPRSRSRSIAPRRSSRSSSSSMPRRKTIRSSLSIGCGHERYGFGLLPVPTGEPELQRGKGSSCSGPGSRRSTTAGSRPSAPQVDAGSTRSPASVAVRPRQATQRGEEGARRRAALELGSETATAQVRTLQGVVREGEFLAARFSSLTRSQTDLSPHEVGPGAENRGSDCRQSSSPSTRRPRPAIRRSMRLFETRRRSGDVGR